MALLGIGKKKKPEIKGFDFLDKPALPSLDIPKFEKSSFPEFNKEEDELDIPIRKPMLPKEPMFMEKERRLQGPLFVKVSKYKGVLSQMDIIKDRLKEAETVLNKLMEIKISEDRELENWQSNLAEIKEKLIDIDDKLFEI